MKLIYIFCAIAVIYLIALAESYADYRHSKPILPANVSNITYNETRGIAMSIAASQHQFNYGVLGWQGSVGVGMFNAQSAISIGAARRFNKTLINGNISVENGRFGGGAGVNWVF